MVIAIEGLASSGKGAVSRALALRHGFQYLDLGLIFRLYTVCSLQTDSSPKKEENGFYSWNGGEARVFAYGKDVTAYARSSAIAEQASRLAADKASLDAMIEGCRAMRSFENMVCDGRNAATIFPEFEYCFILQAPVEIRAQRRQKDYEKIGNYKSYELVLQELKERDHRDTSRDYLPATANTEQSHIIDVSQRTVDECVDQIEAIMFG